MLLLLLLLMAGNVPDDPGTSSYAVRLELAEKGTPVQGIRVRLDDRVAWSDTSGTARFDYLPSPGKRIVVDSPDFVRVERKAGPGGEIEIALTPLARCTVVFNCTLSEGGETVPGAHVRLTREDNLFPVYPLEGWAGFDGALPFRELPPGPYLIEAQAPGCHPLKQELNLGNAEHELRFDPREETFRLSGTARPGAVVTALRASGDDASPFSTTCDASGHFTLELKRSSRGPSALPCRTVLHAHADGFVDGYLPLEFADAGAGLFIPMTPANTTTGDGGSNDAPWDTEFQFRIETAGDQDRYVVDFPHNGMIVLEYAPLPCNTTFRIIDPKGKEKKQDTYRNQAHRYPFDIKAGRHVLIFQGWGNSVHSDKTSTARMSFVPAVDPGEWNDDPATASPVTTGTEILGSIFPKKDRDYYRLHVDNAGLLQVLMKPYPISTTWRVLDTRGKEIARRDAYHNQGILLHARLPGAGHYLICAEHWGNSAYSTEAYRARFDFAPADESNLELAPDGYFSGSINPIKDKDAWTLNVTSSGTLRTRLSPLPISTTVRVLAPDGTQLSRKDAYHNQPSEHRVSLQGPGLYTVEVSHWGNSQDSALPYILSTAFFPNDFWDTRRNEAIDSSSRVSLSRTVTGSIATRGDRDFYRFQVPRRALVTAEIPAFSLSSTMFLYGPDGAKLARKDAYHRQGNRVAFHVQNPGTHWLSMEHWGNSDWSSDRYRLNIKIDREDPLEPNDSFSSAVGLPISTALPATLLPAEEVDYYRLVIPGAGKYLMHVDPAPFSRSFFLYNASGKQIWRKDIYHRQGLHRVWEHPAPGLVYLCIKGWGKGQSSPDRYAVWFAPEDAAPPPLARLEAVKGEQPRTVRMTLEAEGPVTSAQIDFNGDGRFDRNLAVGESLDVQYARGGVYPAFARVNGATGTGWDFVWADARDPADEPEVNVEFLNPPPEALIDADTIVELDAWARDGSAVQGAEVFLDGRSLGRFGQPPYSIPLEAGSVAGRPVELRAVVWSAGGKKAEAELPIQVAPLVNLRPEAEMRVTSGEALVEWETAAPGPSEVTVTTQGMDPRVFTGGSGKLHGVKLSGLEPGHDYTWQARTGDLISEERTLSVIRGIEFVERSYAADIERDYDQKGVVRVVNHGKAPASLQLHVASEQNDLLVGFVGEGSEDMKVSLDPGEYKDVLLGISAQDAMEESYRFHVSLEGSFGVEKHSDVVPFDVKVRMPDIDFEVNVSDMDEGTLARTIVVVNKGETITDLNADLLDEAKGVFLSPDIEHVRLERGKKMSFRVEPALHPDFESLDCKVMVRGIHISKEIPLHYELPEGKRVFHVTVGCGQHNKAAAWFCTNRPQVTTPVTVAPGPQIGQPVKVPPKPPKKKKKGWRERINDIDFFLKHVIAELKKITDPDPAKQARLRADLANEMINARITTFNSAWGTIRQTFPFWDLGNLKGRVDVVRGPKSPEGGAALCRLAWAYKAGACEEHGNLMSYVLTESGVPKDKVKILRSAIGSSGHVYVGVWLKDGYDPDRPWTWGDKAFVADSWMGSNYTPQQAWHQKWIFNNGNSDASPGKGHGSRHWYRTFHERGQAFITSRPDQFQNLIPPDMRQGDKLIPGANQPPPGWLKGGNP